MMETSSGEIIDKVIMKKNHMKFMFLSFFVLFLCSIFPSKVYAEEEDAAFFVSSEAEFCQALEESSAGDRIEVTSSFVVNDTNSDSAPFVIDKEVTITGEMISFRSGGIILGADVTFEDITLSFSNRERNVIMANGHTLTLNNVERDGSGRKIHLLCGGLTGYEGSAVLPEMGSHGRILIKGKTNMGNIYAGSLSGDGSANEFACPASILIDAEVSGKLGEIYGCGALQSPVDQNEMLNPDYEPEAPTADPMNYPVTGSVDIQLYHTAASFVNGATGGDADAAVTYIGGKYVNMLLTLQNIQSITMKEGQLIPKEESCFSEKGTVDVTVLEGTSLDMSILAQRRSIGNFNGGGTIILGQEQCLTIQGAVEGETYVGIGSVFNEASGSIPLENHVYIEAAASDSESFILLPNNGFPEMAFSYDAESGTWMVLDEVKEEISFDDISEEDYYYEPVLWAAEYEITSGLEEHLFVPQGICTRAQAVTFLWRMFGEEDPVSDTCPFTDVQEASYYYKAVLWAVEEHITDGVEEDKFCPDMECTRGQIVTFLWRADWEPEPFISECSFEDVKEHEYYYKAVLWAVENGITTGVADNLFAPDGKCERGQIVTFLYRYFLE